MGQKELVGGIRKKYQALRRVLDERQRRLWAATEAQALPHGGVSLVAQATGLSRSTIHAGMRELKSGAGEALEGGGIRRTRGGRGELFRSMAGCRWSRKPRACPGARSMRGCVS